jgi:hypothetical protein
LKQEFLTDKGYLYKSMLKGSARTDFGHRLMEEAGFQVSAWTGGSDEGSASISIGCGCYSPIIGINSCGITLPTENEIQARFLRVPTLSEMMACIVTIWDADWGVVYSHAYLQFTSRKARTAPVVGWITYLSANRGDPPSLPAPARIVALGDHGSLIILTEDRFTASNPEHVELARRVTATLDQAGLLEPFSK